MALSDEIGTVFYDYGRGLYANITNKCPCRCEFCIRYMTDGLGSADSLWLVREPSVQEAIEMLSEWNLSEYDELVFCGYGEPTERLCAMLDIAKYVKENTHLSVRLNTNGLSDLINGKETLPLMKGLIDTVSVSLNQSDAAKYNELCHPTFGEKAYDAMLKFTEDAKSVIPNVAMSVVGMIPREDIEKCRKIAEDMGVPFRVR